MGENSPKYFEDNFNPHDPLNLEHLFRKEEKDFRDLVKSYVKSTLEPKIKLSPSNAHTKNMIQELGNIGILQKLTGFGNEEPLTPIAYGLAAREVESLDSGFRTSISAHATLVVGSVKQYGSQEIKDKYLSSLCRGELVGAFCLTEPNHGSDPRGMETIVELMDDGNYKLNGKKLWITNAPIADIFIVWAKSKSLEKEEFHGFILDKNTQGLAVQQMEGVRGMEHCPLGSVTLQDVVLPPSNRLKTAGLKSLLSGMNMARYGISWGCLGAAEFCYKKALSYSIERVQFGRPLAQNQLVQKKLADMVTELSLGFLACIHVGQLMEQGKANFVMINMLKKNCGRKALDIARVARDILGANGLLEDNRIICHICNLEAVNTYEGTEDVHSLVIGRAVTGFQAFF